MTKTYQMEDDYFSIHYGIRPYVGERHSGDVVVIVRTEEYVLLGVIDGLGHGKEAADIAQKIKSYIETHSHEAVDILLQNAHEHFKGSRGAVIGLAKIQNSGSLNYVGIGNISCKIISNTKEFTLLSKDGALGLRSRNISTIQAEIKKGERLIMYSDGISNELFRSKYRLPNKGSKQLISTIIEKFGKGHDDVSLIYLNKTNG